LCGNELFVVVTDSSKILGTGLDLGLDLGLGLGLGLGTGLDLDLGTVQLFWILQTGIYDIVAIVAIIVIVAIIEHARDVCGSWLAVLAVVGCCYWLLLTACSKIKN